MAGNPKGLNKQLTAEVLRRYEVVNYRNAAQILSTSAKAEKADLLDMLDRFSLTIADIRKRGGNESDIPKRVASILRPKGWNETRIKGDLHITKLSGRLKNLKTSEEEKDDSDEPIEMLDEGELRRKGVPVEGIVRKNFLDGHKVDFVKGRVAFDLEWNSKDQTFDRDLYAFRAFYECDLIDVAVVLTRGADLNEVFHALGHEVDKDGQPIFEKSGKPKLLKSKYGASTTWMGKLIYRLEAGRQGGCPVLAFGITRRVITDWRDDNGD